MMDGWSVNMSANQRTDRYTWGGEDDETAEVVEEGDGEELDMEAFDAANREAKNAGARS
jgi:hypothetical protein